MHVHVNEREREISDYNVPCAAGNQDILLLFLSAQGTCNLDSYCKESKSIYTHVNKDMPTSTAGSASISIPLVTVLYFVLLYHEFTYPLYHLCY